MVVDSDDNGDHVGCYIEDMRGRKTKTIFMSFQTKLNFSLYFNELYLAYRKKIIVLYFYNSIKLTSDITIYWEFSRDYKISCYRI